MRRSNASGKPGKRDDSQLKGKARGAAAKPVAKRPLRKKPEEKPQSPAVPPLVPLPPRAIPKGSWSGYEEYTGPNGEMVLYQPQVKAPPDEVRPPPRPPVDTRKPDKVPKQPAAPPPTVDDHPHTVSRPPAPGKVEPAPPTSPQPDGPSDGDVDVDVDVDVDEEMRRHREWLRHRFDPPPPRQSQPPDRKRSGTYQRLNDEADDTARRIAALEQERHESLLPDWLWDQLYGGEMRILLVHLRALRWQIEEFVKAYWAGEDPVAAVNRYNREQWDIFLKALQQHLQLLGMALMGIEAMRALQQAFEEALQAADATRRRRASEWLRTRERARAKVEPRGSGRGLEPPPRVPPGPIGAPGPRDGKLSRSDWRRIRLRKEAGEAPPWSAEEKAANERYHRQFPASERHYDQYGQTVGTVSLSSDGRTITVTTFQMSPEGTLSAPTVETMPAGSAPENLGLTPGGSYGFSYTNMGPR